MKDVSCFDRHSVQATKRRGANTMALPEIPRDMMSTELDTLGASSDSCFDDDFYAVADGDRYGDADGGADGEIDDKASEETTGIESGDRSRCVHSAIRILAGREHSTIELKRKLLSRGFDNTLIEATLAQLAEDGLQSDERFTESFVRSRINRGQGPVRIRMELLERGIADAMVAPHLDMGSAYWLKIARDVRERRFGDVPERSDQSWNRQARFLSQRGFPSDVVVRALGA